MSPLALTTTQDTKSSSSSKHDIIVDTFTLFAKLPPEIRIQVWKLTVQEPQVISIYKVWSLEFITAQPSKPGIILINRESRQAALEERPSCFGDRLMHPIHYNFERDIIYFWSKAAFSMFISLSKTSPLISHLMVRRANLNHFSYLSEHQLTKLTKLQTLMLEPPVLIRYGYINLAGKRELEDFCRRRGVALHLMTKEEMQSLANDYQ
jgi:hypothetical protein